MRADLRIVTGKARLTAYGHAGANENSISEAYSNQGGKRLIRD
jgi:hypothetical protein